MGKKTSAEKTLKGVETWYNKLTEREKSNITVFALIGDIKEQLNHTLLVGDGEDLVHTLAQAMVGDELFKDVVKEAVELVAEFEKSEEMTQLGFRKPEKVS